jgi:3-methylfumaryl-CoA hydratase
MTALSSWIGRTREQQDLIALDRAEAMRLTVAEHLPALSAGDPLPPLWHWLYFWEVAPLGGLGYDGHPAKGDFLPPVPLPRRMWAGSRLSFLSPLPLGARATRHSRIAKVEEKEGRSGKLAFVTLSHRIEAEGRLCIEEEHDIVYRAPPAPGEQPRAGAPAPDGAAWRREARPSEVMLFRYSALTFNGHRIHYDRRFCLEREGYPGLVVHGPLLATLMVGLAAERSGRAVASFAFRALAPVFDIAPFTVNGVPAESGAKLWIADAGNRLCMDGEVAWIAA